MNVTSVCIDKGDRITGPVRFFSTHDKAIEFAKTFRSRGEEEGFLYGIKGIICTEMEVLNSVDEDKEREFFKNLWSEPIGNP